jgi:hypothetical protein
MNIEQAKHSAQAFYLAFERCMEERSLSGGQTQFLAVPALVCAAFSVELGLKALLLRKGQEIRGHNLAGLFEALDQATQTRISTATGVVDADFASSLQEAGDVFDEWRYIHEKEAKVASPKFLSAMAKATLAELDRT